MTTSKGQATRRNGPQAQGRREREFAVALQAVVLRLRRLGERRLGIDPLPLSEVDALIYIIDHPGATVTEVANAVVQKLPNMSTTVRSLVSAGLVERRADDGDSRRTLLYATARAADDRNHIEEAWTGVITEHLDTLSEQDRAACLAAASALRQLSTIELTNPARDRERIR